LGEIVSIIEKFGYFYGTQKSVYNMKKIMTNLVIAAVVAFIFTSCAGSRQSMGCPTSSSSKPFRA